MAREIRSEDPRLGDSIEQRETRLHDRTPPQGVTQELPYGLPTDDLHPKGTENLRDEQGREIPDAGEPSPQMRNINPDDAKLPAESLDDSRADQNGDGNREEEDTAA
jgi:hypothetical protein